MLLPFVGIPAPYHARTVRRSDCKSSVILVFGIPYPNSGVYACSLPCPDCKSSVILVFGMAYPEQRDETDSAELFKNSRMLQRLKDIENLPEEDKQHFLYTIDAMLRDAKTRQAYAS